MPFFKTVLVRCSRSFNLDCLI